MAANITMLLTCGMCLAASAAGHPPITEVRGRVVDPRNKPVPSVIIRVYWLGGTIRTSTDAQGMYRLAFEAQTPISELYYDAEAYQLDHIHGLAAGTSHVINKVLYPKTNPQIMPLLPALSSLSAYESVYYVTRVLDTEPLDKDAIAQYREAVRKLLVPEEARARLAQVQALWDGAPR